MDRRTFNKVLTTGAMGLAVPGSSVQAQQSASAGGAEPPTQWPGQVYRRLLVDTHVPDWDPVLLSRFDAEDYVSTIAGAGFQCLMQYAISAAGLCLWRTKIGQMHRGMRGRLRPSQNYNPKNTPDTNSLPAKIGLENGVHFLVSYATFREGDLATQFLIHDSRDSVEVAVVDIKSRSALKGTTLVLLESGVKNTLMSLA